MVSYGTKLCVQYTCVTGYHEVPDVVDDRRRGEDPAKNRDDFPFQLGAASGRARRRYDLQSTMAGAGARRRWGTGARALITGRYRLSARSPYLPCEIKVIYLFILTMLQNGFTPITL